MKLISFGAFLLSSVLFCAAQSSTTLVCYAGGNGNEGFYDVMQLSDGTFLCSGYADELDWVPAGVPTTEMPAGSIHNALGSNRFGLIVQLSSDLQSILHVVHFPRGAVEDIRFMKTSNVPGTPTGDLFISGNTSDSYANDGGYFLARLNHNFIDGIPDAMVWHRNVWAMSYAKTYHPWDVNANNEVVHISGEAHGYNWSAVYWLDENGNRKVVEGWRTHVRQAGGEWIGSPASSFTSGVQGLTYSLMALKSWGRCELRSWTEEDYYLIQPDGNGGIKKGKWPMDILFNGPCDITNPTSDGPGYTGYSNESCCPVYGGSSVLFDRYSGDLYLGMNMKSIGPTASPDFEPALIKMAANGNLLWWSRLYHEITPAGDTMISIPDQYIDALALDYSNGYANAILVVGARSHGNNTENLWEGNTVAAYPDATGFQQQFTGTVGDIHVSWIGKLSGADGTLLHSTYMGEYSEATGNLGPPHPDPLLDSWPNPNGGWPNLNTTYLAKNAMKVSANGDVCVLAEGRRTITTANAWQKMVKPNWGGQSCWNHFVRQYTSDLSKPKYSSLVVGAWDTLTQEGGSNVELFGIWKSSGGMIAVGKSTVLANGMAEGNPMPTTQVPSWGSALPLGESFVIAYLTAASIENSSDGPSILTGLNQANHQALQVFPNPVEDRVTVCISGTEVKSLSPPLFFDAIGRCIELPLLSEQSGKFVFDASLLSKGIYTIRWGNCNAKIIR